MAEKTATGRSSLAIQNTLTVKTVTPPSCAPLHTEQCLCYTHQIELVGPALVTMPEGQKR